MYKASAGVLLPTSIIGSLPRPAWHTVQLGNRSFLEAMVNARWREQYEDAVSTHLRAQEVPPSARHPEFQTRKGNSASGSAWSEPGRRAYDKGQYQTWIVLATYASATAMRAPIVRATS